jgi:hypothetical protein
VAIVGTTGSTPDGSGSGHHLVDDDVDGGPLGGATDGADSSHHLVNEDFDGAPLKGIVGARERPPPYAEEHQWWQQAPSRGRDPICCPNTHWFVQGIT